MRFLAFLQFPDPGAELPVFRLRVVAVRLPAGGGGAEPGVVLPPVDAHFACRFEGGDHQPQLDRQQLDIEQVDLDVARNDDPLVEYPFQDVAKVGRLVASAGT